MKRIHYSPHFNVGRLQGYYLSLRSKTEISNSEDYGMRTP